MIVGMERRRIPVPASFAPGCAEVARARVAAPQVLTIKTTG
jgi:hypothetical protein